MGCETVLIVAFFSGCAITWLLMERKKLSRKEEDSQKKKESSIYGG